MTQQSLITRLKAVEEAFDLALQEWGPCDCSTCSGARSALSDLRELIKEAEEQEQSARLMKNSQGHDICVPESNIRNEQPPWVQELWKDATPLYTALGEKP